MVLSPEAGIEGVTVTAGTAEPAAAWECDGTWAIALAGS